MTVLKQDNSKTAEIFHGIAEKMLTDFRQIQAQIPHKGERGFQREETIKRFLETYLPKKYGVGTGQIINSSNAISRQCDIVVYDALECPLLLVSEGYQLFPSESVLAVIEVKSRLDSRAISECTRNVASVKSLYGEQESPSCFIFAYTTDTQGIRIMDGLAAKFVSAGKKTVRTHRFDRVCVLDAGLLYGDEVNIFAINSGPSFNLLVFFMTLLQELDGQDLGSYYMPYYAALPAPSGRQYAY